MKKISTTCSSCSTTVVINPEAETATAVRASNGVRGSGHVPAGPVTVDLEGTPEGCGLFLWDCPLCEYGDSFDPSA